MKHCLSQRVVGMLGILLLAGCGGGNGSGVQQATFGPLTTRFVGSPQSPITGAGTGTSVTGVAGAEFSTITLTANPQEVLVGPTGKLNTTAAGFFYLTHGNSITSVAAIDAFNQTEVRITSVQSSDPTVLLFNVTAPHGIRLFAYVNGLSGTKNYPILDNGSGASILEAFQVIIDATTGTVEGVKALTLVPRSTR